MEPPSSHPSPSRVGALRKGIASSDGVPPVSPYSRSWWRFLLPLVILGICVGIAALLILLRPKPEVVEARPAIPAVEVFEVQPQTVQLTVKTQGTVTPRTETLLSPEVSGRVLELAPNFESGGFFEKGEVLIELDPLDYEVDAAEAAATLARAQLALAEEEARGIQALEDWKELGRSQDMPSDLVLRKPQLAEARANVVAAQATLELAKRNVDRTQIRAPYEGRVKQKNVDVGQSIERSTVLATIYAVDYAEIRLPIANQEASLLNLPLQYRDDSSPTDKPNVLLKGMFGGQVFTWEGVIDRTEGTIDTRSRLIYLIAQVADPYRQSDDHARPPLHIGLFVEAEIEGKAIPQVFEVPRTALVEKDTVLIVGPDDRMRSRKVKVLRTDVQTAVITEGLEAGERLCISPVEFVIEAMPVLIYHPEKASTDPSAKKLGTLRP